MDIDKLQQEVKAMLFRETRSAIPEIPEEMVSEYAEISSKVICGVEYDLEVVRQARETFHAAFTEEQRTEFLTRNREIYITALEYALAQMYPETHPKPILH